MDEPVIEIGESEKYLHCYNSNSSELEFRKESCIKINIRELNKNSV